MKPLSKVAATALLCMGALPQLSHASSVYGSLSNFDVFNDSGSTNYYGFEIELEGLSASSVPYTFGSLHYGSGQVSQSGANTIVRYSKPGVETVPYSGTVLTGGHNCIQITGCEHFGVSLTNTATATRYYWLNQDGTRSPQVTNLLAPVMTVVQPAVPAQNGIPAQPAVVRAVVEAPEKIEPGFERSDAVWVQVFKTEVSQKAQLDDLMADNPVIADEDNHIQLPQTEMEWKLFQRKKVLAGDPADPANLLDSGEQEVGDGMEQVLRTYRFYAFKGTYLDEDGSHEAICIDVGTCEDDAAAGLHTPYVGALIGQQMVALNLDGILPPAPVPLPPAAWLFGSGLFGFAALARRYKKTV